MESSSEMEQVLELLTGLDERLSRLESGRTRKRKATQQSQHCRWFVKQNNRWTLMLMVGSLTPNSKPRELQLSVHGSEVEAVKAAEKMDKVVEAIIQEVKHYG